MKRTLTCRVDYETHKKFKIQCLKDGVLMGDMLDSLMKMHLIKRDRENYNLKQIRENGKKANIHK